MVQISLNFIILESNDLYPKIINNMSTKLIVLFLVFMTRSVNFNHQAIFSAIKVSDEERFAVPIIEKDRMLAKKLLAEKLPVPYVLPENFFRGRLSFSKLSGQFLRSFVR